ncbi:uncharacterized protein LOC115716599 isoform X2 [Cannabis sativa]|uniref:uncharacterized protein LOC115716599 isoform X2 n=1 Tax=Cannabis sativa TaxID=3483 RepID=UPI0029C9FCF4|nr:uncharacterized protein LOC115716599 isoform X2 [Cannabis sativa]
MFNYQSSDSRLAEAIISREIYLMKFPAISPSRCFHIPANSLVKSETLPCNILCRNNLRRVPPHIRPSFAAVNENNGTLSAVSKDREPVSLKNQKKWIHFVGVGGCGMSALAMLAVKQGYEVSGSDLVWSRFMDKLQEAGVRLHICHSVSNLQRHNGSRLPSAVVISSAIPQNNVEILHAKSTGVPVYKRDYWLGNLTQHHKLIAVSGSHGKSTTTAMLAYVLNAMGDDLTAVVGADVPQFTGGNIISGSSETFVLEADEYDGCFLQLSPQIAVVTNLEWEHVDIFPDEEAVKTAFRKFINRIRKGGHLILCGDSEGAKSLLCHCEQTIGDGTRSVMPISSSEQCADNYKITTYGISSSNDWQASSITQNSEGGVDYTVCHWGCPVADISLQISGIHNILNSLAVIATVAAKVTNQSQIYDTVDHLRLHLKKFRGLSRRFEMIGSIHGCHVFDDYAHHPTEIRAVLQAARQRFRSKALLVVFQPHSFSRLAALKNDFAVALSDADQVIITKEDVVNKLVLQICEDPHREIVILTLGSGDTTTVGPKLLKKLQKRLQEDS